MKFVFCLLFILPWSLCPAQDTDATGKVAEQIHFGVDFSTRWLWRGANYSRSPVIQPGVGYEGKKPTAIVWASSSFGQGEYQEVNFIFDYEVVTGLRVGFIDYIGFHDTLNVRHRFFDFDNPTTRHLLDFQAVYEFPARIPLRFLWSSFVWGLDKDPEDDGQFYSSYGELAWHRKIKRVDYEVFAGFTPWRGYYAGGFAFVNTGFSVGTDVNINDRLELPTKITFVINPETENVFVNLLVCWRL